MDTKNKILVTGGAGYIGSQVTRELCDAGYSVVVFDNLSTGFHQLLDYRAHFFRGDLRQKKDLEAVFKAYSIKAVLHLAAWTSVAKSIEQPQEYHENNVGGTLNLLASCEAHQVRHFVFSSTAAVYADPGKEPVTEKSLIDPQTPYGKSKWLMEKAIAELGQRTAMNSFILRYFNVSGARVDLSLGPLGYRTDLVKLTSEAAVGLRRFLTITGTDYPTEDGTGVRDYIHVQDIADIHLLALRHLENSGASETCNCGYGRGYSVREVVQTMMAVSGQEFPVEIAPRRPGDLARVVANSDRLQKILKWQPRFNDLKIICQTAFQWEEKIKSKLG